MRSPGTVTLCGSARFADALTVAVQHLTARGFTVLGLGIREPGDDERSLARKHFAKIDASTAIYVVNVGGYVGKGTTLEIAYAEFKGINVRWMFPDAVPDEFQVPLSARGPLDTTAGLARRLALADLAPGLLAGYVGGPPRGIPIQQHAQNSGETA